MPKLCNYYMFLPVNENIFKKLSIFTFHFTLQAITGRSKLWFVWFAFDGMRLTGGGS